ncbi:MAG: DUF4349 domain-containing protein [Bacteroidota bacterium]
MKNVWIVSCFFLLMSCQYAPGGFDGVMANADESMQMEASKSSVDLDRDESSQPMEAPDAMADRKIIKNAEMLMEVAELDQAALAIKDSLKRYQAFLSETNLNNNTYRSAYEMTIRVPQQYFDPLLEALSSIAVRIDHRRIGTTDVTEEYLDVETRLKTKKEVRDRYIAILRDKAKTVEDILNAEDKIRVIQEEIESAEGRLRYLRNKVGLSTINLRIYQQQERTGMVKERSFLTKAGKAFVSGWKSVQSFALGLIHVWPFVLIVCLIAFLIGRARSKRRMARKKDQA